MAVYTEVDRKTLDVFLAKNYDLGPVKGFMGIPEGIENTNYHLKTTKGDFILTLFEKRVPSNALPFFLDLMEHLSAKKIPTPAPVPGKQGGVLFDCLGKKAVIITFLPGQAVVEPNPDHCFACGKISAAMHIAARDFPKTRKNPLGLSGLNDVFVNIRADMTKRLPTMAELVEEEFAFQGEMHKISLPEAVVHADLFPDNVFFNKTRVTGVIDFYFAANDALGYDLAVTTNSWCFDAEGEFLADNFLALIEGYETTRPLQEMERAAFPALLRQAALRFLLTRSEDWLNPPPGFLGIVKDPVEYGKILSFHRKRRHIGDYL